MESISISVVAAGNSGIAGSALTVPVLEAAVALTVSVMFTYTMYEPADEGVKVHVALIAPEIAEPFKYH
jgi:hypothetical protein